MTRQAASPMLIPIRKTGANTAISTALDVKLTQVFIVRPPDNAIETAAVAH